VHVGTTVPALLTFRVLIGGRLLRAALTRGRRLLLPTITGGRLLAASVASGALRAALTGGRRLPLVIGSRLLAATLARALAPAPAMATHVDAKRRDGLAVDLAGGL